MGWVGEDRVRVRVWTVDTVVRAGKPWERRRGWVGGREVVVRWFKGSFHTYHLEYSITCYDGCTPCYRPGSRRKGNNLLILPASSPLRSWLETASAGERTNMT